MTEVMSVEADIWRPVVRSSRGRREGEVGQLRCDLAAQRQISGRHWHWRDAVRRLLLLYLLRDSSDDLAELLLLHLLTARADLERGIEHLGRTRHLRMVRGHRELVADGGIDRTLDFGRICRRVSWIERRKIIVVNCCRFDKLGLDVQSVVQGSRIRRMRSRQVEGHRLRWLQASLHTALEARLLGRDG